MAYFKVRVQRKNNTPRTFTVVASKSQDAVVVESESLRDEGITDAKGVEVVGQVNSLRD